jgi:hypothetical protein
MANYPIYYFDDFKDVLGFLIKEDSYFKKINSLDTYLLSLLNCFIEKDNQLMEKFYKLYTITIKKKSNLTKFDLNIDEKKKLIEDGYQSTILYLNNIYNRYKQPIELMKQIKNSRIKTDI